MLKRKAKISVPLAATTTLEFTLNIAPAKAPPPLSATAVTPVSQNVESPPSGANLEPTAERWKPPCAPAVVERKQYLADSCQAATPSVHGATAGKRRRLIILPGMPAAAKRALTTNVVTPLKASSVEGSAVLWREHQGCVGLAAAKSPKRVPSVDTTRGRQRIGGKSVLSSRCAITPLRAPAYTSPASPPPAGVNPSPELQQDLCQGLGLGPVHTPLIGSSQQSVEAQPGVGQVTVAKGTEQGENELQTELQTAPVEITQGLCDHRYNLPSSFLNTDEPPIHYPSIINGGGALRVSSVSEVNLHVGGDLAVDGTMHMSPMTAHEAPVEAAPSNGVIIADQAMGSPQLSNRQVAVRGDASTSTPEAALCKPRTQHPDALSPRVGHAGVKIKIGMIKTASSPSSARGGTFTLEHNEVPLGDAQALQSTGVKTPKTGSHVRGLNPKTPTAWVPQQCRTAGEVVLKNGDDVSSIPSSPISLPKMALLPPPLPLSSPPLLPLRSLPRLPAVKSSELPSLDAAMDGVALPGAAHFIGRLAKAEELSPVQRIATAASARLLGQSLMPRRLPAPALPHRTDLAIADLLTALSSLGPFSFLEGTAGLEARLALAQGAKQESKRGKGVSSNRIGEVGGGRQDSSQGLWQRYEGMGIHLNPSTSATSEQEFCATFDDVSISTTMLQAMCA